MPVNDPKDLRSPVKYKPRPVARHLSKAEIKAAADRAEARSIRATTQVANDPSQPIRRGRSSGNKGDRRLKPKHLASPPSAHSHNQRLAPRAFTMAQTAEATDSGSPRPS
jgi:hypothetical protein